MTSETNKSFYYSWIPNLTGHLNFQYLSDNISHKDSNYTISQSNIFGTNIKYFLIDKINYSDNFDKDKKGENRTILVRIEKTDDYLSEKNIKKFIKEHKKNVTTHP